MSRLMLPALAALAAAGGAAAESFPAVLTHTSGRVKMGVRDAGSLNVVPSPFFDGVAVPSVGGVVPVGLRFVDLEGAHGAGEEAEFDSTSPGTLNEGWGAAYRLADGTAASGRANAQAGDVGLTRVDALTVNEGCMDDAAACHSGVSRVRLGECLEVAHSYSPAVDSEHAFCVEVNLTNTCDRDITSLQYRRVIDWDVEPRPFIEMVTVQPGNSIDLACLNTAHRCSGDPTDPEGVDAGCSDACAARGGGEAVAGPGDLGATFTFDFHGVSEDEPLRPGATHSLTTFYGAAPDSDAARAVLGNLEVETFSLARSIVASAPVHFFGFAMVSGTPPIAPPPPSDDAIDCECERASKHSDGTHVTISFVEDGVCL